MAMRYSSLRNRERSRRRNAALFQLAKWITILAAILGIGWSAYESGLWLAERKVVAMREDRDGAIRRMEEADRQRDDARARLARANDETREAQRRYTADVPTGAPADLLKLAKDRLAAGASPARLAEALRAAQPVEVCEGRLITRRFAFRAGAQPGAEDTANFFDGLITIHATIAPGEDPARPITVIFTRPNTPPLSITGRLPLRQPILIDNSELRFTVAASDLRGYLTATVNACTR